MGLKITCDLCGKEDNECKKFILPVKGQEDIRTGKGNCLVGRFPTILPQEKYVCRDCGELIAYVTDLIQAKATKEIQSFDIDIDFYI